MSVMPIALASPARLMSVQIGAVAPLGPRRVPSAFIKQPVDRPVAVTADGIAGDAQADRRVHGGPDKAVYAYDAAAYVRWGDACPRHAARFVAGAMGENLTLAGWNEAAVMIGDRVRIGSVLLQVSEPRQPCFKLGLAFADPALPRAMTQLGLSGWYYRVLEPGILTAGDTVTCVDRPNPDWSVARLFALLGQTPIDPATLTALVALDGIAAGWRARAQRLLRMRGAD